MPKGIRRKLEVAIKNVTKEIQNDSDGSFYSTVAGEGWNGGYRQALYDVQLILGGNMPNSNNFWKDK